MTQAIAVIPARYGATRFPGKPLATIAGKPMIQHVYERAQQAKRFARVVVATDDRRIADAVRRFGGEAVMTRADHASGTDRIAEAAAQMPGEVICNVQGDEPLVAAESLDALVGLFDDPAVQMATVCTLLPPNEQANPNVVKLMLDADGCAQDFFRQPATGHQRPGAIFKHLGLYGYRRDFLRQFVSWPPSPREQAERLEQLRAVERGIRIKVAFTPHDTIAVDAPGDVAKVETMLGQLQP